QAYVRNEDDLLPSKRSDVLHIELVSPKGNVAQQFGLLVDNGVARGDLDLPKNLPGGLYKIRAYTQWQKNIEEGYLFEKELQVQDVVLPHLKMKLDFERKAFGAGARVFAKFEAASLDNKPLANADFKYVVKIDGANILEPMDKTDRSGTS